MPNALPTSPRDHRAWLEYWSNQLVTAIAAAVANSDFSYEDFRLHYAVHCAHIAYGRALKVRPALKEQRLSLQPRRPGIRARRQEQ